MRILVCGSSYSEVFTWFILDRLHEKYSIDEVIGGGRGLDEVLRWAAANSKPAVWANTPSERIRTFRMFNARPNMVLSFGHESGLSDQIFFMAREARIPIGLVDELSGEIHTVGRGWGDLAKQLAFPKQQSTLAQVEQAIAEGAVGAFEKRMAS
jgi:hypothetical protein